MMMMMMMMKRSLRGAILLLLLLLPSNTGLGSVLSRSYSHIQNYYTWQQAQSYCKNSYYNDLATIFTQSDADSLHMSYYSAWVGLHKTTVNSSFNWVWSDGLLSGVFFWADNEPNYSDSCAFINSATKQLYGTSCGSSYFFICHKRYPLHFEYRFVPQSKTWSEAQTYCRSEYDDLATVEDYTDLLSAASEEDFPVWIGLHRDGETWKWGTGLSEFRSWASGEPGNHGGCVSISALDRKMAAHSCGARFPFTCFRDNLVLVKENKTWEEALEHCRALGSIHHELVSVQPGEEQSYMTNKAKEADTEEVWAGLRFLAGHWLWVNGADMLYPDLPPCPPQGQQCGAISKNNTGSMEIRDCVEKRNFLCYS